MNYFELKQWLVTHTHTSPAYYDGDLYCNRCGEPWERIGIDDGDMTEKEAKRFKAGKGCPSCIGKEER